MFNRCELSQSPCSPSHARIRSATVCHLGNISIRTGKKLKWDPAKEEIVGDVEAAKWANKPYRAPWKLPVA